MPPDHPPAPTRDYAAWHPVASCPMPPCTRSSDTWPRPGPTSPGCGNARWRCGSRAGTGCPRSTWRPPCTNGRGHCRTTRAGTLFFGRTDHEDGARWYVGRRHVADQNGDPVVVDWRADISRAFYRASRTDPMGVRRRRRFGVEGGRITAYEDEHLADPAEHDRRSAILMHEIERPRVGPMRDIVATIQPEQDEIVRAELGTSICVQGAPGTGKTAVGLHRAAWLLYMHRERLSRSGALVIGPNSSFLDHVAAVLPSLGEMDVRHATLPDLLQASTGVQVRGQDDVRRGDAQGRCPDGPGAVPSDLELPARAERGARAATWVPTLAAAGTPGRRDRRRARRSRRAVRGRPGHAAATAGARTAGADGSGRRLPGRPGAGRGRPLPRGAPVHRRRLARGETAPAAVAAAHRHRPAGPVADGVLDRGEQQALRPPRRPPPARPAGAGRRRPAGRDERPARPDPEPRARGAGRGAGPVRDAVAGGRPALLHRLGHRAGRPGPGHHAVGGAVLAQALHHLGQPGAVLEVLDRVPGARPR